MKGSVTRSIAGEIKAIKRVAYGYRADAYFFLKTRVAFPRVG